MTACGSAPAPPSSTPTPTPTTPAPTPVPSDVIQITGGERLAWSQAAASIADLHFVMYIDNVNRVELQDAACGLAADSTYNCESPLPPLTKGRHSLELAAWVDAGGSPLEGARAAALMVEVVTGTTSMAGAVELNPGTLRPRTDAPVATADYSGCGVVAASTGELVMWDVTGRINVIDARSERSRALQYASFDDTQGTLASLAIDPRVAKTGWIYVAQLGAGAQPMLRIIRYRRAGDVLGERAVLFQDALAQRPARIRLRADVTDRLYVAVLDGDTGGTQDGARAHQFLIRLTADGRPPIENVAGSVFAPPMATHPIDVAWPVDGSLPVVIEQTGAHTFKAATANPDAALQAASFATTSMPIAAQFGWRDAVATLWVVLANGELLSLEDTPAGWHPRAHRPLIGGGRASYDAVFIGADEMAVCGPAAGTSEPSDYGIWRIRLRN
jgi:Glucose / Sorbosone dehydrogenase